MSSLNSSGADNSSVNPARNPDEIPPNRQEAFNRIFLYLKALHFPEEKARAFTCEALQLAGRNKGDTGSAIPEAMRALRELLKNQLPLATKMPSGPFLEAHQGGFRSMPPVNRGFMVPSSIDLIPWRTALVRSLKKAVTTVARPINFLILFIFLIIVFVLLTFWK